MKVIKTSANFKFEIRNLLRLNFYKYNDFSYSDSYRAMFYQEQRNLSSS